MIPRCTSKTQWCEEKREERVTKIKDLRVDKCPTNYQEAKKQSSAVKK